MIPRYKIAKSQVVVTGYKKVREYYDCYYLTAIVTLYIPKGTLVGARINEDLSDIYYNGRRKLRTERAKVISIRSLGSERRHLTKAYSDFDLRFIYRINNWVAPKYPFSMEPSECASGIHFFLREEEAEKYSFI